MNHKSLAIDHLNDLPFLNFLQARLSGLLCQRARLIEAPVFYKVFIVFILNGIELFPLSRADRWLVVPPECAELPEGAAVATLPL